MLASQKFERRLLQLLLFFGDVLGLACGFILAQLIRFHSHDVVLYMNQFLRGSSLIPILLVFAICNYIFDLYEPRHWRSRLFSPLKIFMSSGFAALILFAWLYFLASQTKGIYGRGVLLGAISIYTFISLVFRYFVDRSQRHRLKTEEWAFIGTESAFRYLQNDLKNLGLQIHLHFLESSKIDENSAALNLTLKREWSGIIIDQSLSDMVISAVMKVRLRGQVVLSLLNFYEINCGKIPVHSLNNAWFAFTEGFSIIHSAISIRLKRLFDIFISLMMLLFFSPLMLVLALFIRLESRGRAFYSQIRVGQDGTTFTMWKFRSMKKDAEESGAQWAAANDSRVTFLGRIMRKVRLDELPQLWNILKGDMSFIGPRPERPEFTLELGKKIPFYEFRHLVKPGLTGWAQVMYPYGASEEDAKEKLQYELYYIKNYSFELDLKIIFKTVSVILFGAGR